MELAKVFIVVGVVFVVTGVLLALAPRGLGVFSWFGSLPGDIYIRSERSVVFIPWVSMLVVSAGLSVGLWGVRWVVRWVLG